jgi:hypothetical protein
MCHGSIRRMTVRIALLAALSLSWAHAADIIVTSPADPGAAGDAQCTLSEAIANANANADVTAADCTAGTGDDSITFAASVGATIALATLPNDRLSINDTTGSLAILGPGADQLALDGGGQVQIFDVNSEATIDGLTLRRGSAIQGGAIRNTGTLTLRRSVLRESGFVNDNGGGIWNLGTLTIIESTITDNGVTETGGGIDNRGTLTIVNSTVSGNRSRGPGGGAGIRNSGGGVVTLFNTTITANVSTQEVSGFESRGGGIEHDGASFTIMNSIVAGNSAPAFPENADCVGPIISLGYNLVGPGCPMSGPGDQAIASQDVSTYIGALTNNGGPTPTHALLSVSGNPAVDTGDPANCRGPDGAPLTTDQRGLPRPSIRRCDMGAYELQQTFPFHGFFPLIAAPPKLNLRIAGAPVVVSFSLDGNRGLDIFAPGSPSSRRIDCTTHAPLDASIPATTVGGIPLQYLSATDSYLYLWQTRRAWANTCREFSMTLIDGTTHTALFRLK